MLKYKSIFGNELQEGHTILYWNKAAGITSYCIAKINKIVYGEKYTDRYIEVTRLFQKDMKDWVLCKKKEGRLRNPEALIVGVELFELWPVVE